MRRDSGNNDVHLKASTSWHWGWGGTPMAAADMAAGLLGWYQRQLTCHCCCGALLAPQVCDLASLAAIRALAEEWLASGAPLDLLVNKLAVLPLAQLFSLLCVHSFTDGVKQAAQPLRPAAWPLTQHASFLLLMCIEARCTATEAVPIPPACSAGLMLHERTPSADGYEANFAGEWSLLACGHQVPAACLTIRGPGASQGARLHE